ncbi:hypothetical protein LTR96_011097 [Exophiala xenobiotica]|nr:hypothetical protein LTR72_011414 [Exophiala xenobiotica]KAK5263513.1 hypothetical protein LTR96_011097 [Exophiala xenobiotica]KAK5284887.1 hypothetical protein LTR14_011417 [Exophiala xenobiotica]KAK5332757.1 hypothetical protein LTR98_011129 [Exophiala xenobiotica]KAK5469030.1 hypothetical protein LTR55_011436 [Exophiala xenobiotica]
MATGRSDALVHQQSAEPHRFHPSQQNASAPRRRTTVAAVTAKEGPLAGCPGGNRGASIESEHQRTPVPRQRGEIPEHVVSSAQRISVVSVSEQAECLSVLFARVTALKKEREEHKENIRKLQGQIEEGEAVCGRLLQQSLKLKRAIDLKKQHILEDNDELSREQRSRNGADEEMNSVLTQISALVLAGEDAPFP